jgi:hypothetical protein
MKFLLKENPNNLLDLIDIERRKLNLDYLIPLGRPSDYPISIGILRTGYSSAS